MVEILANIITFLIFALPFVAIGVVVSQIVKKNNQKKAEAERIEKERVASMPRYRTETNTYWVVDCDCAEKYI